MTKALFVSALLLAAACATGPKHLYQGDPRPLDELGVFAKGGAFTFVAEVDDQNLAFSGGQGVYVLPGKHKVKLMHVVPGSAYAAGKRWTKEVEVNVAVRHTYLPRSQFADGGGMRLWLEDRGTNYPQACLTFDAYKQRYEQFQKVAGCP